jgi:hypothetical protein
VRSNADGANRHGSTLIRQLGAVSGDGSPVRFHGYTMDLIGKSAGVADGASVCDAPRTVTNRRPMGTFARSWQLTKLSFGVIKQDSEMLLFPLLAGIFSLLFSGALLVPTVLIDLLRHTTHGVARLHFDAIAYVLLGVSYLGLSFVATFFNVCVVYTTKTRFEGGDATFFDSIKFAFSKVHLIFAWSLVSATVGLLLHALDQIAQRAGFFGKILIGIVRAMLGALWSIVTIFVVPAMVYEDVGPFDAIKRSAETLRATWGESLVRYYGLGLVQFLFMFLGVLGGGAAIYALVAVGAPMEVFIGAIAAIVVYFLGVVLVFSVANSVFNTALYAYANGRAPAAFQSVELGQAFRAT